MDLAGGGDGRFGKRKTINLLSNNKNSSTNSKVKNAWTRSKRALTKSNAPQYRKVREMKWECLNFFQKITLLIWSALFTKWPQRKQNKSLSACIMGTTNLRGTPLSCWQRCMWLFSCLIRPHSPIIEHAKASFMNSRMRMPSIQIKKTIAVATITPMYIYNRLPINWIFICF